MTETEQKRLFADKAAFRQRLKMAAVQVAGLSADDLARALAYEVEPFSGIPAAEADLAFVVVEDPDPAVRVYDIAVVRRRKGNSHGGEPLSRFVRPALFFGLALLLVAGADFGWLKWRMADLSQQCARREPLQRRLRQVASVTRSAQDETANLRAARAAAAAAQENFARRRAAFPELLQALAGVCGGRAVVRELRMVDAPFELTVRAVAPGANAAASVTVEMAKALGPKGWQVESGPITARREGSTAEFECRLKFTGTGGTP